MLPKVKSWLKMAGCVLAITLTLNLLQFWQGAASWGRGWWAEGSARSEEDCRATLAAGAAEQVCGSHFSSSSTTRNTTHQFRSSFAALLKSTLLSILSLYLSSLLVSPRVRTLRLLSMQINIFPYIPKFHSFSTMWPFPPLQIEFSPPLLHCLSVSTPVLPLAFSFDSPAAHLMHCF